MKTRREISGFSLSFLDTISCGFGAIILLLVLSKHAEPIVLARQQADLRSSVTSLRGELERLEHEAHGLEAALTEGQTRLSQARGEAVHLREELSHIRGRYAASTGSAEVRNTIEGRLTAARQQLTAEMKRLLGKGHRRTPGDRTIGGIPVDSEYIIFVIDTSASMHDYGWKLVVKKLAETLAIYPQVKGIQVMNDMGDYMFSQYRRKWIPDSPARRRAILKRLQSWRPFSNSSPVEGITEAIRTFHAPDKKISIYVFGDEYTGGPIDEVLGTVARLNRVGTSGSRRVRIHAVGFPIQLDNPAGLQTTGIRFATLMRTLCARNGGTFVALNRYH